MGPFTGAIVVAAPGAAVPELAGDEPATRGGVVLEERHQQAHDLLNAGLGGMRAVVLDVVTGPFESVSAAAQPVRPQVRPPADPGPLQLADDPVLDQPADGVAAVVGRRLGVEGDR